MRELTVRAFTLIELLLVVAIIAILAAIAVPNFLEARTRAAVARSQADMRTMATALEAYWVDWAWAPYHGEVLASGVVNSPAKAAGIGTVEFAPGYPITTPVAYLTAIPRDPLLKPGGPDDLRVYGYIQSRLMKNILLGRGLTDSANAIEPTYGGWRLYAAGPDGDKGPDAKTNVLYDPTNGTLSDGDLVRTQKQPVLTTPRDEQ
ncbi:prepilin-type N-terminal cleavage/methylation domain-containing protein [bacterium]|nr:prepilin-type N-terminal cleavage/methylation domain-containing protein [bacterium]